MSRYYLKKPFLKATYPERESYRLYLYSQAECQNGIYGHIDYVEPLTAEEILTHGLGISK